MYIPTTYVYGYVVVAPAADDLESLVTSPGLSVCLSARSSSIGRLSECLGGAKKDFNGAKVDFFFFPRRKRDSSRSL